MRLVFNTKIVLTRNKRSTDKQSKEITAEVKHRLVPFNAVTQI